MIINSSVDIEEYASRFWSKVDKKEINECWEWKKSIQSKGYGSASIGAGRTALAHRVAFELANGEIPQGLCVLHRCDNRKCCNPNHLFLGTIQDNNKDMITKGRNAKGEKNGRAKLSLAKVAEMRALYSSGKTSYKVIAKAFEVTPSWAKSVIKGDYWKLPLAE